VNDEVRSVEDVKPCPVCGCEERGQGGYLQCECPARPLNYGERTFQQMTTEDLDQIGDEICAHFGGSSVHAIAFEGLRERLLKWASQCTGKHGSQAPCVTR
jgi:hypothetical protein